MADHPVEPPLDVQLFAAVRAGDPEAVRRAIAAGANPRAYDGDDAPLHVAVRTGSAGVVEALLAGNALEWQTDGSGRTPLDLARLALARA